MDVYRLQNVVLSYEQQRIRAEADLVKSTNGEPPFTTVQHINPLVDVQKDPKDIAKQIQSFAAEVARNDALKSDILLEAEALLEGAEVKLKWASPALSS